MMKELTVIAAGLMAGALIGFSGCHSRSDFVNPVSIVRVVANPDDGGKALPQILSTATTSIDIVIYQIGDPDIQTALLAAMQRGVSVRVIMDNYASSTAVPNAAFVKAMVAASAAATPPVLGNFQAHWSSNNFNITHQKTLIIDASGGRRPSMVVSTGNFYSSSFGEYWAARDFYIIIEDPSLIRRAEEVFNSDFACDGNTVTNGIVGETSGPLLYSNGSLLPDTLTYPGFDDGYYPGGMAIPIPDTNQGNVGPYQVGIIDSAVEGDVLCIYNEELRSDTPTVNELFGALLAALGRGVVVKILMSAPASQSAIPPLGQDKDYVTLAAAGAQVHLLAPEAWLQKSATNFPAGHPSYIHAKAFLLSDRDGAFKDGYVGSTNGSANSIYFNRELGLALRDYAATAQSLQSTFNQDFDIANPAAPNAPFVFMVPMVAPTAGGLYPAGWGQSAPSPVSPGSSQERASSRFSRNACGSAAQPDPG